MEQHSDRSAGIESVRKRNTSGHSREALRFLVVGGLSFLVDFGLLVILHEVYGFDLIVATPVAFLTSLVVNYALQRYYAFKATAGIGASAVKYLALVAFNTVAASSMVAGSDALGLGYEVGKVLSTALMTVWNFFLYKHWIFPKASPLR